MTSGLYTHAQARTPAYTQTYTRACVANPTQIIKKKENRKETQNQSKKLERKTLEGKKARAVLKKVFGKSSVLDPSPPREGSPRDV